MVLLDQTSFPETGKSCQYKQELPARSVVFSCLFFSGMGWRPGCPGLRWAGRPEISVVGPRRREECGRTPELPGRGGCFGPGPSRPPGLRLAPRPRWPRAGLSCLAPGAGAPGTRAPRHVPPGGALRKGVEVEEDSERLRAARSREGGGARALKAAVVGGPADPPSRAGASGRAGGARTARARRRPLFRRWAWPGRARARAAAASRRRREPGAGSAARRGAGPSVGPPRASRAARPPAMPGFDYKFLEKPKRRLLCPLCGKPMREPVQVSTCGHRFCDTCLQEFLRCGRREGAGEGPPGLCPRRGP